MPIGPGCGDDDAAGMDRQVLERSDQPLDQRHRHPVAIGEESQGQGSLRISVVRGEPLAKPVDIDRAHAEGLEPFAECAVPLEPLMG